MQHPLTSTTTTMYFIPQCLDFPGSTTDTFNRQRDTPLQCASNNRQLCIVARGRSEAPQVNLAVACNKNPAGLSIIKQTDMGDHFVIDKAERQWYLQDNSGPGCLCFHAMILTSSEYRSTMSLMLSSTNMFIIPISPIPTLPCTDQGGHDVTPFCIAQLSLENDK